MKKFLILTLFLSILIFPSWVHADGPYLNIPPTNAFDKAHSQNGTINAVNFSMPINFIGRNGVNVTSNNSTHTIIIIGNGTGPKGATGATGNFTCTSAHNCVNLNDTQTITGNKDFLTGINIFNQYILGYKDSLSQEAKLQGLSGSNFNDAFVFMPRNDTANAFTVDIAADPIVSDNEILLQALQGLNQITGASNSSGSLFIKTVNASGLTISEIEMLSTSNNIDFHNAQLNNITNPSSNQDAVTKYWHDHFLGSIGNLTQNKCSNLEFLAYQQSNQTWICSSGSTHGTYNETLANNAVINSGGSKTNYINGTGNPVHVVNSNSGQQVNVTISNASPTFTTRTIDLSGAAYNTVIDNNTGTISITATSKPTSPQFVQTISSGNIPTDTTDVKDYTAVLTVGGKNTNATTSKAISMIATRNGVEVGGTQLVTVTNGNFWESGIYFSASALNSGDKLGLKMWCSSSPCTSGGGLDFRYATIYIIPRQFVNTNNGEMSLISTGTSLTILGTIPGVTYSTNVLAQIGQNSFGSVTDSILGSTSGTIPGFLVTIKGQSLSELTSSREIGDITTSPTQQAASNLLSISFAKFVRINTLS